MPMTDNILIIKLGALGDVVQSFGIMRAIAGHYDGARITVLTTPAFAGLIDQSGIADHVIAAPRPKAWHVRQWLRLIKTVRQHTIIYDLQNNDRTQTLFHLARPHQWIGKATDYNAQADKQLHMFEAHRHNLAKAGIAVAADGYDDLRWMAQPIAGLGQAVLGPGGGGELADAPLLTDSRYALLVPGSAPQHGGKRWPYYESLALALLDRDITPVLIGTQAEAPLLSHIAQADTRIVNMCGQTSLGHIVTLAQHAILAIGNDTGPMHFIGPTGCKTLALFSGLTSPARYRPLGQNVKTLQMTELHDLNLKSVLQACDLPAPV